MPGLWRFRWWGPLKNRHKPSAEELAQQIKSKLRNYSKTFTQGTPDEWTSQPNPFDYTIIEEQQTGGRGVWWRAKDSCDKMHVREVVHATTEAGRYILCNTGGHGAKADGADPTNCGYGEFQFIQEDMETIGEAPEPGKVAISVVSTRTRYTRRSASTSSMLGATALLQAKGTKSRCRRSSGVHWPSWR